MARKRKSALKKVLLSGLGFVILTLLLLKVFPKQDEPEPQSNKNTASLEGQRHKDAVGGTQEVSFFVPYWNIDESVTQQPQFGLEKLPSRALYFGIPVTTEEVVLSEADRRQVREFSSRFGKFKRSLTLRMTSTQVNLAILEDGDAWASIGTSTIALATEYGFDRVILDLEVSTLPTESVKKQIVDFSSYLGSQIHKANLGFDMTIYGDVLYRGRPYDLAALDNHVDRWYIMAYDFHKAGGLPGPSFPLRQGDLYPYSFEALLKQWPLQKEKTHIVLGMFGYTWRVDDRGRPLRAASAVTTLQGINKKSRCERSGGCSIKRDPVSSEMVIREPVEGGYWDETWYNDAQSTTDKISFLRSNGFLSISFWALGYF